MQFMDKRLLALTGLALALLAVVPFAIDGYWIRVLTVIFMFGVVAQGLNLMAGFMGYIPFGNAMFYGIGAYTSAIAMQQGIPFLATVFLGGLVSVAISVLFGLPVLRLRGHYFAIATIGLSGGLMSLAQNFTDITGGAMGTTLPIVPLPPQVLYGRFYWGMLALMVMTTVCMALLIRSRFGFAVRSIKANEEAANAMGINTTRVKVITWAVSAFFTSLAGSVYAYWMSFIAPAEVFDVMIVVNGIVILLVGGLGTVMGPILGAFTFELVSELTWSHFGEFHMATLGAATILIVFLIPNGLIGKLSRVRTRGKQLPGKEMAGHGS